MKQRRAPNGYRRMDQPLAFQLSDADGNHFPPIDITTYMSNTDGSFLAFHDGHKIHGSDITEFRKRMIRVLTGNMGFSEPTKHIAVVVARQWDRGGDAYGWRYRFWPVLRRTSLDGTVWWSSVFSTLDMEEDEIEWSPTKWTISDLYDGYDKPVIHDWSPTRWCALQVIQQSITRCKDHLATAIQDDNFTGLTIQLKRKS